MLNLLAVGALALGLAQQTDTTFNVRPNGTVAVENFGGSIVVRSWDRNQLRVRATHSGRTGVEVGGSGSVVQIEVSRRYGPGQADIELTLPKNFGITAEGVNTSIDVQGLDGNVSIETVNGTLTVRDVRGRVDAESVQGLVTVENVNGRVHAASANRGVRLRRINGELEVEALNGSIVMHEIESRSVSAETINGAIEYQGSVTGDGRYSLATHNGRITMGVPEGAGARVTVYTYNGHLSTSFAADVGSRGGHGRYNFTLGSGNAEIELESFSGAIQLVRPGEIRARTDSDKR